LKTYERLILVLLALPSGTALALPSNQRYSASDPQCHTPVTESRLPWHNDEVAVEGKQILLRTWRPQDNLAFQSLVNDPATNGSNTLMWKGENGWRPIDVKEFFLRADQNRLERLVIEFAVVLKKQPDVIIGLCQLHRTTWLQDVDLVFLDPTSSVYDFGILISNSYWGNGYGTEVTQVTMKYAFQTLNADSVRSVTKIGNGRMKRIFERFEIPHSERRPNALGGVDFFLLSRQRWEQNPSLWETVP